MARILRGSIYWADLNPVRGHEQSGTRPIVVLSQDIFNEKSGTVIAMAITSQPQRRLSALFRVGFIDIAKTIMGQD